MTQYEISAQVGLKVAEAMTNTLAPMIKSKLDEKQDTATMPTKVSDFTNDSGFQNAQQVEDKIDAKISSAYKAGGSATMATLPALSAAKLGVVVNMSENFTTTADFLEGAGKSYPAGTNVVVALAGENVYKYDVLSGFVDLSKYVQDTRKIGNVPLSADIPVSLTGDTAITVTNTGTASAIGYSITLSDSGVTAGSKGNASNQTPGFGGTFKTLSASVDAKGRLTALNERNVTIPSEAATTSAAGLMSAADKDKLDNIIDATLSNSRQAADAKATGDALAALRNYLASMEVYRTASGNPATFDDGKAANLKDVAVTITPTQSGSGDPYPPGGGKNILAPPTENTVTANGITFSFNKDAGGNLTSVTASGTLTNTRASFQYAVNRRNRSYLSGMILSGTSGSNCTITIQRGEAPWDTIVSANATPVTIPEISDDTPVIIYLMVAGAVGDTISNAAFYPMIRASGSDPVYEPYSNIRPISGVSSVSVTRTGENGANPETVTVTLADGENPLTVYGGTLDVTTGELTVTHANIASYNGETLPGRWMSDRDVYAPDATPTTGAQVVYELAAPVTYPLTPAQLAALSGYNAVSSDAGNVSVTYRADTAITFGGVT